MTIRLSDVLGFGFDFDGVFYNYQQISGFNQLCDRVRAQEAVRILNGLIDYDTALRVSKSGYETYGDNISGFCYWAKNNGIDPDTFRLSLFQAFHSNLRSHLNQSHPQQFVDRRDLTVAFSLSHGRVKNGIATHSCARNWAEPFIHSMGIKDYFFQHAVKGLDDAGFVLKHNDPLLFEMCFASMGIEIALGAAVEDTSRNLKALKERHPKTHCVYIHHGNPLGQQPIYIDSQFRDIPEMKRAYASGLNNPTCIVSLP